MLEESHKGETFFTSVGCMDGRVQNAVNKYASLVYGAEFPDTITKAGLDGLFASEEMDDDDYNSVEKMVTVSIKKHKSFGVVVHGHEGCAGNPVDENQHKKDIKKAVLKIKKMVKGSKVEVKGVYVRLTPRIRIVEVV